MSNARSNARLLEAAREGDIGTLRSSLASGADKLDEALRLASEAGQTVAAGYLIGHGANVFSVSCECLHLACREGHLETVRLLLDHGADPCSWSGAALRWAAMGGRVEVVRLLLDHPEAHNLRLDHPLLSACEGGGLELVRLLVERGLEKCLFYQPDIAKSALKAARRSKRKRVVEYLLSVQKSLSEAVR